MAQANSNESLRWKINSNLRQAVFELENSTDDPVTRLLYSVVYGYTSTTLATKDMLSSTTNTKDLDSYLSSLSLQALFLASEYPFLQPQLVDLINTILWDPRFPEESKDHFSSELITDISDTTKSNYGHLFNEKNRTKDLIDDHINLHRFLARLLPFGGLVDLDDAMYMLCVGLEDFSNSHGAPDIDIPAAAQYVIHAATPIFGACVKGLGQDFTSRGRSWTGAAGLNCERWGFWKRSFAAVESTNAAKETKSAARTAVRAMVLADGMT